MYSKIIAEDCVRLASQIAPRMSALFGSHVLVTGASGFLGSYFLDVLTALNDGGFGPPMRITAMDNFKVGLPRRVEHLAGRADVTFLTADICEPFAEGFAPDYIIHLAGIASPLIYRAYPLETIAVNVDGTRNVLELARTSNSRSMLSFSSSEIYGDPDPARVPTSEDYRGNVSCMGPRACYDESKRMNETLCYVYHQHYGVPVKVIRPFNTYGPGQRIDDGRIIPDLMKAAIEGGPLVLYSDGRATRSFCYVADFVRGCLFVLCSNADGHVFNVGNDHEISIGAAAQLMAGVAADPPLSVEFRVSADADYLVDNPNRRCPDLTKLRTMMAWEPEIDLVTGLARTLAHYRAEFSKLPETV